MRLDMTSTAAEAPPALRRVAMPSEHGGWGLTLEPVLLGLLVAPSWAGVAIGLAAFAAFLLRTPAKLVGVDVRRDRWLPRTRLAAQVAATELILLLALLVLATVLAGPRWWLPVAVALPAIAVELWFDVRSRGRRLAPELAGAIGVAATTAAIVLARDDLGIGLAFGVWLVLGARSVTAIPFVRARIARRRGAPVPATVRWDVIALAMAGAAVALEPSLAAGAIGVAVLIAVQRRQLSLDPPVPKVIGLQQLAGGLVLVAVTALGVRL